MKNVFIVGAKGIPAKYGGYESFVEQLTKRKVSDDIHYFVACRRDLSDNKRDIFLYNGATCFNVDVPNIGPARAILYDIRAIKWCLKYIKENSIKKPIIYVLACRIGPFIANLKGQLKKFGGKLMVNPDGHEWLRAKWSRPVRHYWKVSEKLMVKNADLLICDSKSIEHYIKSTYKKYNPNTIYISYGSEVRSSTLSLQDIQAKNWFETKGISPKKYYLIVGRFVPENNYETMIKEFMRSSTESSLVIISNVQENKFYKYLQISTNFDTDPRIKFVGTVYDSELLKLIRENATGYIHGHEVGGTNPSLLEAMGSTKVNLLLDVGFNHEVGMDSVLYWTKKDDDLSKLIDYTDGLSGEEIDSMNDQSNLEIKKRFDWLFIVSEYERTFLAWL